NGFLRDTLFPIEPGPCEYIMALPPVPNAYQRAGVIDGSLIASGQLVPITLGNLPPVINVGGPYSVQVNTSTTLTATVTDPNGDSTSSYAWDLNDDGQFESPGLTALFSGAGRRAP